MKKNYSKPAIEIIKMETEGILCNSQLTIGGGGSGGVTGGFENGDDDDDDVSLW